MIAVSWSSIKRVNKWGQMCEWTRFEARYSPFPRFIATRCCCSSCLSLSLFLSAQKPPFRSSLFCPRRSSMREMRVCAILGCRPSFILLLIILSLHSFQLHVNLSSLINHRFSYFVFSYFCLRLAHLIYLQ